MEEDLRNVQKAANARLEEAEDQAFNLSSLGDMLLSRYERTGNVNDLQEAISNTQSAIELTPPGEYVDLGLRLSNLGDMFLCQYERTGKTQDLETAISKARKALEMVPHDHPDMPAILNGLGNMLSSRYEQTGELRDLDDSINIAQKIVAMSAPDHPDIPAMLNNLANKFLSKYKRTGEAGFLQEAIGNAQRAVDATTEGDPHVATISSGLASMLLNRYKRMGDVEDLEKSIIHIERAIRVTPQDHPSLAFHLSYLGNILSSRHTRTGNREDLDNAISAIERAIDLTPPGHPNACIYLNSLGSLLWSRYQQTGNIKDLEDGIENAQRGVNLTHVDHPSMAAALNNLGNKLSARYERLGKIDDLDHAIREVQRAIDLTSQDHPALFPRLMSLGIKLIRRYERLGRTIDMEQAIIAMHRAIRLTPEDHADLFTTYSNLGCMLLRRYQRTGNTRDLHESISSLRRAIHLIPSDHAYLATLLNDLGSCLTTYYERTRVTQYLEEAVEVAERAANLTSPAHPNLVGRLMNLGNNLFKRFEHSGEPEDLDKAINSTLRAVEATPEDHPNLAEVLDNLGCIQFARHNHTGKSEDLEEAIGTVQRAVDLTPQNHASLSLRLNDLAQMLVYETTMPAGEVVNNAIELYEKSFKCASAVPLERLNAARRGIQLLAQQREQKRAYVLADEAMQLLPQICSRYLSYEDQQHATLQIADLAANACSLCLRTTGDPERALEILEHGRGLIIGYLIDGTGGFSELKRDWPEKAEEFDTLRQKVSVPSGVGEELPDIRLQLLQEREEAIRKLEQCMQDIRQLRGQERFFLPPSSEILKGSASDGPILVVNITNISSDAIIVSTSGIKAIPLPKMQGSKVDEYRPWSLSGCVRDGKLVGVSKNDNAFGKFLARLWSDCVRPIFEELGFHNPPKEDLPRVWWIGTGLASSLPFHAAGVHHIGSVENVASCVISTYTPTIKALLRARESSGDHPDKHSVLVVTMPTTPGGRDLPGVEGEEKAIRHAIQHPHRVKTLPQPSKEVVLSNLRDFSIVHFACHGSSDLSNPSSSFLALRGDSDTIPDKLTVQEMANLDLGKAWLAYLSACSTAENNVSVLADEVLHLASAFQVAGFRHVMAAMWPCKDSICAQIASTFYRHLTSRDTDWGSKAVATAWHAGVMELRKQNPHNPSLWAQYIHAGA